MNPFSTPGRWPQFNACPDSLIFWKLSQNLAAGPHFDRCHVICLLDLNMEPQMNKLDRLHTVIDGI